MQYLIHMSTQSTRIYRIFSIASLLLFTAGATDIAAQTTTDNTSIDSGQSQVETVPDDISQALTDAVPLPADDIPANDSVADSLAPPARNPQAELNDARARYADSFAAEQYPQARDAAGEMVTLTAEIYGSESTEYALALSDLAAVQSATADLANATANYKKTIDLVEARDGIVSPQLIRPLMGLAAVQNAMGEWDRGLQTYNRALRLNHVELGLNNIEQMPIRDGLTETYLGLGSIEQANFQQEVQMRIVRDEFGGDLSRLIQASNKLADWYKQSNQQEKEVLQLEMTVRTIRNQTGDDGAMQIKVLRDLAAAYQRLDLPNEETLNVYNAAVASLNEASRINNESASPDPVLNAAIQIDIADVHTVFGESRDARRLYTQAWQILAQAGVNKDVFDTYFGTPTHIGLVNLPAVYPDDSSTRKLWLSNPDRFQPASLQALVDVDDYGHTDNIRITEASPQNLLEERAIYLLKRYRYRPRFENGQPVVTSNLPISHTFNYLPDGAEVTDDNPAESSSPLEYPEARD